MADIEDVYTALAEGIDQCGQEKEAMFLAKVGLLLAEALNDPDHVLELIAAAAKNVDGMRPSAVNDCPQEQV